MGTQDYSLGLRGGLWALRGAPGDLERGLFGYQGDSRNWEGPFGDTGGLQETKRGLMGTQGDSWGLRGGLWGLRVTPRD